MDSRLIFLHYQGSIKTEGGTRHESLSAQWFQRQVQWRNGEANPPFQPPGKSSKENPVTVPQTDTGGQDEYSKALG